MNQTTTPNTVTYSIAIDCPASKAVYFMLDAKQWLPWTMPQVESVQPLPFKQWLVKTTTGFLKLRPHCDLANGILDYELVAPVANTCYVPMRIVPTDTGCHLAITFNKPDDQSQGIFESDMLHTAKGLHYLKLALEQI